MGPDGSPHRAPRRDVVAHGLLLGLDLRQVLGPPLGTQGCRIQEHDPPPLGDGDVPDAEIRARLRRRILGGLPVRHGARRSLLIEEGGPPPDG